MNGWPIKKLGEIATIQMGQSPPGDTYNFNGIGLPFFQGKAEFGEEHPTAVKWCSQPTRIADAGDILISVRAPVGPTNVATERCCIGRGLAAIRGDPTACSQRYIHYYLKRFEADIAARGVGSTFTAINRNDIARLELPVPPLSEQERIVKRMDEADELRKLRARADRRTGDLIPALFHEMFGDPIANEKRWPTKPLGELVDFRGGGTPRRDRPDYWGGDIPWASVKDLKNQWLETTLETITTEGLANSTSNLIPEGTVIIASRVGLGKAVINRKPVAINQDLKALTPRNGDLLPRYLLNFLLSKAEYFERAGVGATVKGLTIADYQRLDVPVPPRSLQMGFVQRVTEIRAMEAEQTTSRRRLDDLFQSLLHRAFEGEL